MFNRLSLQSAVLLRVSNFVELHRVLPALPVLALLGPTFGPAGASSVLVDAGNVERGPLTPRTCLVSPQARPGAKAKPLHGNTTLLRCYVGR
jgi:hypothetical protein